MLRLTHSSVGGSSSSGRRPRETLKLKCSDLSATELARRSVEPSALSILGLVRQMADAERHWFRIVAAGEPTTRRYRSGLDRDGDFSGAVADPAAVEEAWKAWGAEVAVVERLVGGAPDLAMVSNDSRNGPASLREVLVHMVEEYARHNGHAELLRERIDGRVGL